MKRPRSEALSIFNSKRTTRKLDEAMKVSQNVKRLQVLVDDDVLNNDKTGFKTFTFKMDFPSWITDEMKTEIFDLLESDADNDGYFVERPSKTEINIRWSDKKEVEQKETK